MRYIMQVSTESGSYHEDFGPDPVVAEGQAAALVDALIRQGFTVAAWPGAPMWDASCGAVRFVLALLAQPDEGASGGIYLPGGVYR